MQLVHPFIVLIAGFILVACAFLFHTQKTILLVYSFTMIGYLLWLYVSQWITDDFSFSPFIVITIYRFGLLGYLMIFAMWYCAQKPQNRFFRIGDGNAVIRFPFIWKGMKEIIWRFTLIFSLMCLSIICFFVIKNKPSLNIVVYGMIFSVVNALLEEFLWRGFILSRLFDISDEKTALIVSAVAFGLYHYSLQFPLWACFIFAIGGFYMGGSAIKSKGLRSAIIMHVMVNLVFVFSGIIF